MTPTTPFKVPEEGYFEEVFVSNGVEKRRIVKRRLDNMPNPVTTPIEDSTDQLTSSKGE